MSDIFKCFVTGSISFEPKLSKEITYFSILVEPTNIRGESIKNFWNVISTAIDEDLRSVLKKGQPVIITGDLAKKGKKLDDGTYDNTPYIVADTILLHKGSKSSTKKDPEVKKENPKPISSGPGALGGKTAVKENKDASTESYIDGAKVMNNGDIVW